MSLSESFSFISTLLVLYFVVGNAIDCTGPLKTIQVSQTEEAQFKTIQSAIDTIPLNNSLWTRIQISSGTYSEIVRIKQFQECIYLEGAGMDSTMIKWDGHANGSYFVDPTLDSQADNIVAKGIAFVNTYNDPMDEGPSIVRAEAARVDGDKCAFFECSFWGVQDTLHDQYGRHYFKKCYIQGGTDFIFGDARSIYEDCDIVCSMGIHGPSRGGMITANKRDSENDESGFVLKNCNISGNGKEKCGLGRAYGNYSRVIIADSFLGDVVDPVGWSSWNIPQGQEENLTYVEEGNTGPGADTSKRVKWMKHLSREELQQYLDITFIDQEGWIKKLPINN